MAFFVAFYSYKGGVGRTLALANAAYALAARGKRVVLVDLDLEAPGLQEYKEFAIRGKSPKGFLEYAAHYRQTGKCPALKSHVHACKDSPGTGKLWLMPSGAINGSYQKQLGDLSWRKLHPQKGTTPFLETFRKALDDELQPDYVLIDSRTGLSDIGGLTTHQLADLVVLVFNLTRSCLEGSVRTYRSFVSKTSKARFLQLVASPVPPLAPSPDSIVERRLAYAREHMPLGVAYGRMILRIDYNPAMALTEELAVRHPEVFPAAERYEALREAIQRVNPDEVFPILEQARELRSAGRLEDGLALLEAFTKSHPEDAEGYVELGDFLVEAGRSHDAIPAFRKASDLAPNFALARRRLGEALAASGEAEEAIAHLKTAEKQGEKSYHLYLALARAYRHILKSADEVGARRQAILELSHIPGSKKKVREISKTALLDLRSEFVDTLQKSPPYSVFRADAFWNSVLGSFSLPRTQKLEILVRVLSGAMGPAELNNLWRILREEESRWNELLGTPAFELRAQVAEGLLDPTAPDPSFSEAEGNETWMAFLALSGALSPDRQIDALERAWQRAPGNLAIAKALSSTLLDQSKIQPLSIARECLEKSIQVLTKSIPLSPPDADARLLLGRALSQLSFHFTGQEKEKLLKEACAQYEQVIQDEPSNYRALNHYSVSVGELASMVTDDRDGLIKKSEEFARRASQVKPGFGDYNLACALSLLGNYEEAERTLQSALRFRPGVRLFSLTDPDLAPLWEARPDLRASIAAALPPPTPPGS